MHKKEEYLSYEKLLTWEKSVVFALEVMYVVDSINTDRKHYRILEQIEACSTSVSMNIAKGKGRCSLKEYKQFLFYSSGSLYETLTLMKIFKMRNWIEDDQYKNLRTKALEINRMLNSLMYTLKIKIGEGK